MNALSNAIVGISNNILTSPRLFNTYNAINYNYNIIPLSSYLFGGTIGLSFELYRTGFFGNIIVKNNLYANFDYSYNYVRLGGYNTFSSLQVVSKLGGSKTTTICGEVRLEYVNSEIAMFIQTASNVPDICYIFIGGTINNYEVTTNYPNKNYSFNILSDLSNLVNGILTVASIQIPGEAYDLFGEPIYGTASATMKILWKEPLTGGYITDYEISYYKDVQGGEDYAVTINTGSPIRDSDLDDYFSYILTDLVPLDPYVFVIRARNILGLGNESQPGYGTAGDSN
jgi:hypothetical protein